MTPAAEAFVAANKRSAVVSGSAPPEGGGTYTLKSGKTFTLTLEDCRSMPSPRWDFSELKK